jgi:hypothetical protein
MAMNRIALAAVVSLAGCSGPQLYGGGQAWQKTECQKLQDAAERNRCMASTNRSYDDYKREQDAGRARP